MRKLLIVTLLLLVGISVSLQCYGATNEDRGSHFSDGVYTARKHAASDSTALLIETADGTTEFKVGFDGTTTIKGDVAFQNNTGTEIFGWDQAGEYRQVWIDNTAWINAGANAVLGTTATVTPHLILTDATFPSYIKYYKGGNAADERYGDDATPIACSFRVPDDYRSTPTVVIIARNAQETGWTPNYIDFQYTEYSDGDAVAGAWIHGTEAIVGASPGGVAVEEVTLTLSDTYIDAGDYVTLHLWPVARDRTSTGAAYQTYSNNAATTDLYIFGAAFRYIAQW